MHIEVSGIEKKFGYLQALSPLELIIEKGEFVSLLGPSGCGKTTFLRILAGLETPDQGAIKFGGDTIFSKTKKIELPPQKRNIGMVFQDFALWPHMTVFDNVAYSLRATGEKKDLKLKVEKALENVHLEAYRNKYPHQLSGGQQQRVAFARAIANNPPIVLLDEPLSALDAALRDDMRFLLQTLVKKLGITAIYVTHDQSEAMAMSDRIVVMNQGKVMQFNTPEEIYHKPENEMVAAFVGRGVLLKGSVDKKNGEGYLSLNKHAGVRFPINNWHAAPISGDITAIVRPENVSISETKDDQSIVAIVESSSFFGEHYELLLRIKKSDQTLLAYSSSRFEIGREVYCQIDSQHVNLINQSGGQNTYETA
ncbi:ABC transporter ATP-binding protein [Virgibacillus oceani]